MYIMYMIMYMYESFCPPQGSSVCVRVNYHSISPQIAPSTEGLFNRRVIRDNLSSDSQRGYTVKRQYRCKRKREAMLNSGGHRTVLHLMFDYTQESRTEYQNGYFLQAIQYIQESICIFRKVYVYVDYVYD